MRNKAKYMIGLLTGIFLLGIQPAWAAGSPSSSIFNNSLAVMLMIVMVILLMIIGLLAGLLVGSADVKLKKKKEESKKQPVIVSVLILVFLLTAPGVFAQNTTPKVPEEAVAMIGGMTAWV